MMHLVYQLTSCLSFFLHNMSVGHAISFCIALNCLHVWMFIYSINVHCSHFLMIVHIWSCYALFLYFNWFTWSHCTCSIYIPWFLLVSNLMKLFVMCKYFRLQVYMVQVLHRFRFRCEWVLPLIFNCWCERLSFVQNPKAHKSHNKISFFYFLNS